MLSNIEPPHDFVDEIIDLEEFAKAGKVPPRHCKGYRIRIDKQFYTVTRSSMTGRELLELAEKTPPERYRIDQKFCGGRTQKIELDEKVDFTKPGVERFMTLPLDQTEGYSPRRQFQLPEADEEFLNARGLPWETVAEGGSRRVILLGFPVPPGYKHSSTDLNIRIEPGYPDAQLDMVYFYPALALVNGGSIRAIAEDHFDGKVWQRWSRHRTHENPWVPGVDYIGTHLGLVEYWLEREVARG
jgi:Prokaryotic E2 family E/Multiubiquitin